MEENKFYHIRKLTRALYYRWAGLVRNYIKKEQEDHAGDMHPCEDTCLQIQATNSSLIEQI